jgi:hypothetical protein
VFLFDRSQFFYDTVRSEFDQAGVRASHLERHHTFTRKTVDFVFDLENKTRLELAYSAWMGFIINLVNPSLVIHQDESLTSEVLNTMILGGGWIPSHKPTAYQKLQRAAQQTIEVFSQFSTAQKLTEKLQTFLKTELAENHGLQTKILIVPPQYQMNALAERRHEHVRSKKDEEEEIRTGTIPHSIKNHQLGHPVTSIESIKVGLLNPFTKEELREDRPISLLTVQPIDLIAPQIGVAFIHRTILEAERMEEHLKDRPKSANDIVQLKKAQTFLALKSIKTYRARLGR